MNRLKAVWREAIENARSATRARILWAVGLGAAMLVIGAMALVQG